MKGYPKNFYPVLMITVLLLLVTGGLLIPTLLDVNLEWSVPWRLHGDWQISVSAIHTTVSFMMIAIVGSLWNIHMRAGWRHRKHWRSGISLVVMMFYLLVTAIGIYYLSNERLMIFAAVTHLVAGLLVFALFIYHAIIGYQSVQHHRKSAHKVPSKL